MSCTVSLTGSFIQQLHLISLLEGSGETLKASFQLLNVAPDVLHCGPEKQYWSDNGTLQSLERLWRQLNLDVNKD